AGSGRGIQAWGLGGQRKGLLLPLCLRAASPWESLPPPLASGSPRWAPVLPGGCLCSLKNAEQRSEHALQPPRVRVLTAVGRPFSALSGISFLKILCFRISSFHFLSSSGLV
uniref:Uncharacterized protein n=1 Tax=Nomascus leucogenys TaxID=61853 RepID=A0A2I3HV03_NOMLE